MGENNTDRPEESVDWVFYGQIVKRDDRTTKGGKQWAQLVVKAVRGKYEKLCVFDCWSTLPSGCVVGNNVRVQGRMSGREWQGKYYAGLTAESVVVYGDKDEKTCDGDDNDAASPARPAASAATPTGGDAANGDNAGGEGDNLPF